MRFAITDHAVERFQERVAGAENFTTESVRDIIRNLVLEGFAEGVVSPHPRHRGKRIVPFKSGESILYLSLGPNDTLYPGDFAVAGVMFERDLGGKIESGVTLGDIYPTLLRIRTGVRTAPRFIVVATEEGVEEHYDVGGIRELRRGAGGGDLSHVRVYRLLDPDEVKKLL